VDIEISLDINYPISIGQNIFLAKILPLVEQSQTFLCVDYHVYHNHQKLLQPLLAKVTDILIIEATEEKKSQKTVDKIMQMLHTHKATRKSQLIALGGGIIGDVVGYAAAIYMRGIPFIQVPTTLLSQVDSSIGSKVAINAFTAKNIIGTFYSPQHVIIDIHFLTTLTERIYKEGLVELVKHGFIADKSIISLLDTCVDITTLRQNEQLQIELITRSLQVKKAVVETDFYDQGQRHILNFGHTFAHALEMSGSEHYYHGECVAIGMLVMAKISTNPEVYQVIRHILEKFACLRLLKNVDLAKIMYDKKRTKTAIKEILLPDLGKPSIEVVTMENLISLFTETYTELQNDVNLKTCKQQFIFQPSHLKGTVHIPASKSYAHRYLLAAALADTTTILTGLYDLSDDILVTKEVISTLGCKTNYDKEKGTLTIIPQIVLNNKTNKTPLTVQMKESGTSLRLLLPTLIAKLRTVRIIGENKLPERPMHPYFDLFTEVIFTKEGNKNLPLLCDGKISTGNYELAGNISSQFISGLLFVLPLLNGNSTITMKTPLQSIPYVAMTLDVLKDFGVKIEHDETFTNFNITGNQSLKSTGTYEVEQDYSSRGFWEVAKAIGNTEIDILPPATTTKQGDAIVGQITESKLHEVDLTHVPDTAPILAVYFAYQQGILCNTDRLKFKESDRLAAICDFLTTMKITFTKNGDTLEISQGQINGGYFNTYKDHRITMSLIIASTIAGQPIIVDEIASCDKSYASFIATYQKLGGRVDEK